MSHFPQAGRLAVVLSTAFFLFYSFSSHAQCDVTITPQGPTTFCQGDSVTLIASAAGDSLVLDQSQTLYNGGTSARNLPGYSYWQSFEAGVTGTLVQIDAGFFTLIDGTGYWTVWEGSGTGGTMLDSQVVNIVCGGGNCLLSFAEDIPITAGSTYTFQIRGGPNMPDPYGLQIGAGNPYTAGDMGFVDPSGTYLTDFDWVFNTWVQGGGVTYLWSNGSADTAITVSTEGDYVVNVTSTSGCTSTADVEVTVNPLPEVNLQVADDTVCVSDATVLLTGTPQGGTFSGINVSANLFTPASPGEYTVYYTYTDVNGCTNTDSAEIVAVICEGLNNLSEQEAITVTSNLSNGKITIVADAALIGSNFILYNDLGAQILNVQLQNKITTLDVARIRGMCLYAVRNNYQLISSGKISLGQ